MAQSKSYFELDYEPPWKGTNVDVPENKIDRAETPFSTNWIPRGGELRTRPKQSAFIPGLPDNSQPTGVTSFQDSNNVVHTIAVSTTGLWQLNPAWLINPLQAWNLIGRFTSPYPVLTVPAGIQIFLDKLYFVTGDYNLWSWDGLTPNAAGGLVIKGLVTSVASFVSGETLTQATTGATVKASQIAPKGTVTLFVNTLAGTPDNTHIWTGGTSGAKFTPTSIPLLKVQQPLSVAQITVAPVNTGGPLLAGGLFLGELDSRLILLNCVEQQDIAGKPSSNFPQRIRWSASGLPTVWDPTVDVGAGFSDEIDVPDVINGFLTIGRNGFVFRANGITEMTSISGGVLPFDFNHLWASERGIGSVQPFSIAGYGPIGIFIADDDIYELSLGGFKKIGGKARNAIYTDLANAISLPIASLYPKYKPDYPYLTYKLNLPQPGGTSKVWCYFVEAECWFQWTENTGFETGKSRLVPTK